MTAKEFETTLRELLNKKPFQPFEVEYLDGRRFWVDAPHVAFSGGGATFLGPNHVAYTFDCNTIKRFVPVAMTEVKV